MSVPSCTIYFSGVSLCTIGCATVNLIWYTVAQKSYFSFLLLKFEPSAWNASDFHKIVRAVCIYQLVKEGMRHNNYGLSYCEKSRKYASQYHLTLCAQLWTLFSPFSLFESQGAILENYFSSRCLWKKSALQYCTDFMMKAIMNIKTFTYNIKWALFSRAELRRITSNCYFQIFRGGGGRV